MSGSIFKFKAKPLILILMVVFILSALFLTDFSTASATQETSTAAVQAAVPDGNKPLDASPASHSASGSHKISYSVPPLLMIPFAALLLAIAVMPFINKHFWEHNYPYISYALGIFVVFYYLFVLGATTKVMHTMLEYISFIALIGSLFVVTGGIVIKLKNDGNPVINSAVLFIGSVLANIIGTTGASMLLIRPFIRINHRRIRPYLIVFFIFTISNIGGALTPIGDPPLFLGYLQGVPFFWVIEHVIQMWGVAIFLVIGIFFAVDYFYFSKDKVEGLEKKANAISEHASEMNSAEEKNKETGIAAHEKKESKKKKKHKKHEEEDDGILPDEDETLKFKLLGVTNFLFLFIILVAVFLPTPWREIIMLACAVAAYRSTPKKNHIENGFNFEPIREVAILFIGIFATMMPALDWLEVNAAALGIKTPGQFYWGSGMLSGFLDNAPTYLNFLSAAKGLNGVEHVSGLLATAELSQYVIAISLGSVFFGAMTYIGNGPNFMVKNISEQMNVKMPSFFGYVFIYSLPVLIPVFALVWALFLR